MNKTYRSKFNKVTGSYVAVSEVTATKSKSPRLSKITLLFNMLGLTLATVTAQASTFGLIVDPSGIVGAQGTTSGGRTGL